MRGRAHDESLDKIIAGWEFLFTLVQRLRTVPVELETRAMHIDLSQNMAS